MISELTKQSSMVIFEASLWLTAMLACASRAQWPPDPSTLISVISISVAIMIYSLLRFFDALLVCLLFGLWVEKACRQKGAPNMLLFQQVCLSLGTQWHESRTSVLIKKGDEQHSAWITVGVWTFNRRFDVCETFLTVWMLLVL